jgi:hypothetical protein
MTHNKRKLTMRILIRIYLPAFDLVVVVAMVVLGIAMELLVAADEMVGEHSLLYSWNVESD